MPAPGGRPPGRRPMDPNARRALWGVAGLVVLIALVQNHNITSQEIILFCVVVPSIILHEISHGAVAWAFGDDTAKRAGRLTLNPIRHIDPVGTLIVPALLSLGGFALFGWAKPVPVNNARLRHPRNEGLLVSLAGPFTNALLAGGAAALFITQYRHHVLQVGVISGVAEVVFYLSLANLGLMVFNLIPIPPLDGSAVLERFLPRRWWPAYLRIRPYTMFIIMGAVLINFIFNPGPITVAFQHLYNWWFNVLVYGRS